MSFDGVVLTLLAVLLGAYVGLARNGRLVNVAHTPVRAKALLVLGVAVPAFADRFTRDVAVPLVIGGLIALFAFAMVNVRVVGMSVMAIGILANLAPTFLNGGLPVRRDALVDAGLASRDDVDRVELSGARRLEEPDQQLRILGDIIPLRETGQVLSFGDLIILIGLADITANLTLRKRRDARRNDLEDTEATWWIFPTEPNPVTTTGRRNPRPHVHQALDFIEPVALTVPDLAVSSAATPIDQRTRIGVVAPDLDPWNTFPMAADNRLDLDAAFDPFPAPQHAVIDLADDELALDLTDIALPPDVIEGATEAAHEPPDIAAMIDIDLRSPAFTDEPEPRLSEPEHKFVEAHRPPPPNLTGEEQIIALFADLGSRKRQRRSGQRNIPDFEPIHLDDPVPSLGRRL